MYNMYDLERLTTNKRFFTLNRTSAYHFYITTCSAFLADPTTVPPSNNFYASINHLCQNATGLTTIGLEDNKSKIEIGMSGGMEYGLRPSKFHEDVDKAFEHLNKMVRTPMKPSDEAQMKEREEEILTVGKQLAEAKSIDKFRQMIERIRPFLVQLGKAKAAKLVRDLVDLFLTIEDDKHAKELEDLKVSLCNECVDWARQQNRVFLRQSLQARLVRLHNDIHRYQEALAQAQTLIRELKKVDDKELTVEVQLEESKACYHLQNLTKARAALTSARTTANSVYIPPFMQASLDMQSGILHAADERDFKTAFSYFYEAFEGYDSIDKRALATRALKYMCLSKIMLNTPDDVTQILSGKLAIKYSGSDLDAMRAVASAASKRSLAAFNKAFGQYRLELQCDPVVKTHFGTLSDSMLEKDLCRIIEPYSRVQIAHVAKMIDLEQAKVERKLAQMILDNVICGTLDEGSGVLIVFAAVAKDAAYEAAVQSIKAMALVVDALEHKINKLT